MSDDPIFDAALKVVLAHEGGFVDNPADPGGATKYGISLRWLQESGKLDLNGDGRPDGDLDLDGHIDINDIKALTPETAGVFYRAGWWDKYGYGSFHLTIATKLFDLAVNMGASQAHKVLQRAARACGMALVDDGVLGPVTRSAIAGLTPSALAIAMRSEAAGFYRTLAAQKPALAEFLPGWLNRAYS